MRLGGGEKNRAQKISDAFARTVAYNFSTATHSAPYCPTLLHIQWHVQSDKAKHQLLEALIVLNNLLCSIPTRDVGVLQSGCSTNTCTSSTSAFLAVFISGGYSTEGAGRDAHVRTRPGQPQERWLPVAFRLCVGYPTTATTANTRG